MLHDLMLTEQQYNGVVSGANPTLFIDGSRIDILPKQHVMLFECMQTASGSMRRTGRVTAGIVTAGIDGYPLNADYRLIVIKPIANLVELHT